MKFFVPYAANDEAAMLWTEARVALFDKCVLTAGRRIQTLPLSHGAASICSASA
jgi:hypothetical protein